MTPRDPRHLASQLMFTFAVLMFALVGAACSDSTEDGGDAFDLGGGDIVVIDTIGDSTTGDMSADSRTDSTIDDTGDDDADAEEHEDAEDDGEEHEDAEDDGEEHEDADDDGVEHDAEDDGVEHDADDDGGEHDADDDGGEHEDIWEHDAADVENDATVDAGGVCGEIETAARAEWLDINTCANGAECRMHTNALCPGVGSCPVLYGYEEDLTDLENIESRWDAESCGDEGFCLCEPPDVITCNRSRCTACPRCLNICRLAGGCIEDECGCPLNIARTCENLRTPLRDYALTLTQGCEVDDDCRVLSLTNCGRIDSRTELGCWLAAPVGAHAGGLNSLLQQNADLGCVGTGTCLCPRPADPVCDRGTCRFPSL